MTTRVELHLTDGMAEMIDKFIPKYGFFNRQEFIESALREYVQGWINPQEQIAEIEKRMLPLNERLKLARKL